MKPKTHLEKYVYEHYPKLKKLSEKQKKWAIRKSLDHPAIEFKHETVCLSCGYRWKNNRAIDCPKCGIEIHRLQKKNTTYSENEYICIIDAYGDYQVVRYFFLTSKFKYNHDPEYNFYEVICIWIAPNGKYVILSKKTNPMSMYYDAWVYNDPLSVKYDHHKYHPCSYIYPDYKIIYPVLRNGFQGMIDKINPEDLFVSILKYPKCETLIKANQVELFKYAIKNLSDIEEFWSQIKICIRHRYYIESGHTWIDHLRLLQNLNLDIFSPKYICPEDLNKEHDILNRRWDRILDKQRKEEELRKLKEREKEYRKLKKRFFKIKFSNGELNVKVLTSVKEFIEEGKALNHCIYASGYYRKEDSLILSARKKSQRLETVEFSLSRMKIIQAYGESNKQTEYHKDIIKLINENVHLIKQAV